MASILNSDERELLKLIATHEVVAVPFWKPLTDGLEAKRLVVMDQHGVFRVTEYGAAVIGQMRRLH